MARSSARASAVPDEAVDGCEATLAAGVGQLVRETHGEHRISERGDADADGGRAGREEVQDVVDRRHAADPDDRDVHDLGDLVDHAQRHRPERGPADPAVAAAERGSTAIRGEGEAGERVDRADRIGTRHRPLPGRSRGRRGRRR